MMRTDATTTELLAGDADLGIRAGSPLGRGLLAAGAFVLIVSGWIVTGAGGEVVVRYVDDLATMLAALVATLLCVRAGARDDGRMRRFWWLLGAASGSLAIGEMFWALYELVLVDEVPVPSWADAAYLSSIPLAAAALLSHPGMRRGAATVRSLLDGLVVAVALLFLGWVLVLGPLWHDTDLTTLGGLVTLAYPFTDIVLVFLIVLVVRRMGATDRLALSCLLIGLLMLALTDIAYAYLQGVEGYETGQVIDVGWIVAYLGIALGALCAKPRQRTDHLLETTVPSSAAVLVPFAPMLGALCVAGVQLQLGHRLDTVGFASAFALVLLVLARQALLVIELSTTARRSRNAAARLLPALGGAMPATHGLEHPPTPERRR